MKQIKWFLAVFLCYSTFAYAVTLDDYVYEEDDIVGTAGNGKREFVIVAKPEQAYECEKAGRNKPVKEGLLFVGSRYFSDYIGLTGDDDVVKSSLFLSVYSKNEDMLNIKSPVPFNENYNQSNEIYFVTYHSIDPAVFKVVGKTRQNNSTDYELITQNIQSNNIGCYFIMAENQTSEYGIGYYWLYVTKSYINKDTELVVKTKYLEDPTALSKGTSVDADIYTTVREHTYRVIQDYIWGN